MWAVYIHPIIRLETDPVPVLATGDYDICEAVFFEALDNPEIDEFYLELAPAGEYPMQARGGM